ncbi:MAG: hypothetical protein HKN85_04070, partial [Gammaproteobacteria bacterium]|nr:hypothetical protein [Gammaproteobacteria bacterium]
LPEWPFGFDAKIEHRLKSEEIKNLLFAKVWKGKDIVNGGEFIQETDEEGKTAFRSGYSLVSGEAWVEDDKICLHFPSYGANHKNCAYLFRDPDESGEPSGAYALVGKTQILKFSVETLL